MCSCQIRSLASSSFATSLFGQGALDDQIALFGKVQPFGFGQGILQTLSIHLNSSGLRTWWVLGEYSVVNG